MSNSSYSLSDFDYHLPSHLIAQHPSLRRDEARLLILDRKRDQTTHKYFKDILDFLAPDDVLVLNETKVLKARLLGKIMGKDNDVEVLIHSQRDDKTWLALTKPAKKLKNGVWLDFGQELKGEVVGLENSGHRLIRFKYREDFFKILEEIGHTPLPPYIKRQEELIKDNLSYQTIYAKNPGSSAAPTAGLHFTRSLLSSITKKGIKIAKITLHLGPGSFQPIRSNNINQHNLIPEYYQIKEDQIKIIREAKGRVVACGTSVVRALETAVYGDNSGLTNLFIHPPYKFKTVDALITNFHLPKSTLLILVSAFAGLDNILSAYQEAIIRKYRFYSFGDAMFII